jgi:Flp pilus assembly protein TadG
MSEAVMWKVLFRARQRFARDQRGNFTVLFAFSVVPLIGLLGGAVDATRHHRHKVELANALDAAAIALVKKHPANDGQADAFVQNYMATMTTGQAADRMLHVETIDATEISGGYRVTLDGYMETAFLPVVGIPEMPLDIETEVMMTGGTYEIALALDNTGSMAERNKIGALREASNHLVDSLYKEFGADDRVRMALIPFTTTVNIRGEAFDPAWLDPTGLGLGEHRFDGYNREVSRLDIFDALGNGRTGPDGLPVAWKGCVEARDGDYDTDDTPPGREPATRWTPYLSPDGADSGSGPSWARQNSYILDGTGGRGTALERLRNVDKYLRPTAGASYDLFDAEFGPNQACRGPIVELTNVKKRMRDAINAMQPGGYTHIPQGLAWGWRVLSPEAPFTQGAEYDDTTVQKVLVLLSDGKNTFPETYTSYGFRADGRLASNERNGVRRLNEKVTAICEQVKANNIRLYMILLEENDRETRQIFEDCASRNANDEPLYYEVPDAAALDEAFADIGKDLTNIRITR